jgi:WhiB family transcriptional regulator, redox-sensing transcriptional regulator
MSALPDWRQTLVDFTFRPQDGWRALAACRGMNTDVFYPEGRGRALREREQVAKLVCAECPVIRECRQAAAEAPEHYGIWGGLTESERGWSRR